MLFIFYQGRSFFKIYIGGHGPSKLFANKLHIHSNICVLDLASNQFDDIKNMSFG